jgi:hypothetical protein
MLKVAVHRKLETSMHPQKDRGFPPMNQGSKLLKKVQLSLSKMGLVAKVSPQGEKEVQLQW